MSLYSITVMKKYTNKYIFETFKPWLPRKSLLKGRNLTSEVKTFFSQPFSFVTVHSHNAVQGTGTALCWRLQVLSPQNTSLWFCDWKKKWKGNCFDTYFSLSGYTDKKTGSVHLGDCLDILALQFTLKVKKNI